MRGSVLRTLTVPRQTTAFFRAENKTNNSGGINGGIANGMPIVFRACFRPVPTVMREQLSIDFVTGEETVLTPRGRHDVCILPRGCAAVEAAAAIALLDLVFRQ